MLVFLLCIAAYIPVCVSFYLWGRRRCLFQRLNYKGGVRNIELSSFLSADVIGVSVTNLRRQVQQHAKAMWRRIGTKLKRIPASPSDANSKVSRRLERPDIGKK